MSDALHRIEAPVARDQQRALAVDEDVASARLVVHDDDDKGPREVRQRDPGVDDDAGSLHDAHRPLVKHGEGASPAERIDVGQHRAVADVAGARAHKELDGGVARREEEDVAGARRRVVEAAALAGPESVEEIAWDEGAGHQVRVERVGHQDGVHFRRNRLRRVRVDDREHAARRRVPVSIAPAQGTRRRVQLRRRTSAARAARAL